MQTALERENQRGVSAKRTPYAFAQFVQLSNEHHEFLFPFHSTIRIDKPDHVSLESGDHPRMCGELLRGIVIDGDP